MAISPFDHPWLSAHFGDDEIAALFTPEAQVTEYLAFEVALAETQAEIDLIPAAAAAEIVRVANGLVLDPAVAREGVSADGLVIPAFTRAFRARLSAASVPHFHLGATSQDLLDTALVGTLRRANAIFADRAVALDRSFAVLAKAHGSNPLMGRTRMQAALPVTVADRVATWRAPVAAHAAGIAAMEPCLCQIAFGGPVGTRGGQPGKGDAVADGLARRLGLHPAPRSWHTARGALGDYAAQLSLVTGALGKFGGDIALMAQQGIDAVAMSGGGTSSAMPHKSNPVAAETLVAIARFNAGMLGTFHQALVHEQERSGSAWALEMMILPQMVVATGAALRLALRTAEAITRLGDPT